MKVKRKSPVQADATPGSAPATPTHVDLDDGAMRDGMSSNRLPLDADGGAPRPSRLDRAGEGLDNAQAGLERVQSGLGTVQAGVETADAAFTQVQTLAQNGVTFTPPTGTSLNALTDAPESAAAAAQNQLDSAQKRTQQLAAAPDAAVAHGQEQVQALAQAPQNLADQAQQHLDHAAQNPEQLALQAGEMTAAAVVGQDTVDGVKALAEGDIGEGLMGLAKGALDQSPVGGVIRSVEKFKGGDILGGLLDIGKSAVQMIPGGKAVDIATKAVDVASTAKDTVDMGHTLVDTARNFGTAEIPQDAPIALSGDAVVTGAAAAGADAVVARVEGGANTPQSTSSTPEAAPGANPQPAPGANPQTPAGGAADAPGPHRRPGTH